MTSYWKWRCLLPYNMFQWNICEMYKNICKSIDSQNTSNYPIDNGSGIPQIQCKNIFMKKNSYNWMLYTVLIYISMTKRVILYLLHSKIYLQFNQFSELAFHTHWENAKERENIDILNDLSICLTFIRS